MPAELPPSPWRFAPETWPADDDCVAAGADLQPSTLLAAYRAGAFPMPVDDVTPMLWWSPLRRGVLELSALVVSRSLRRSVRAYEIRVDTAFHDVVLACANPARQGGWINRDIVNSYAELHRLGWAHSVEAWRGGELEGGLYGLAIGGLFAGESMFHRARDASKVALVGLIDLLYDEYADHRLVDVQWQTDHLASLGATEVDRADYLARLTEIMCTPLPEPWR